MILARKMPAFYIIIAQKYFSHFFYFPIFFWGGDVPPTPYPPPPVSYAYGFKCSLDARTLLLLCCKQYLW